MKLTLLFLALPILCFSQTKDELLAEMRAQVQLDHQEAVIVADSIRKLEHQLAINRDPSLEDREGAEEAFEYLNWLRAHPKELYKNLGFWNGVVPEKPMRWNDTLYQIALEKGYDMAINNYFEHSFSGESVGDTAETYGFIFLGLTESLASRGDAPKPTIDRLLIDENTPCKGHRRHLLNYSVGAIAIVNGTMIVISP